MRRSQKNRTTERRTIWKQKTMVSHRCSSHHGQQSSCSLETRPHNRHASHGHQSSFAKRGKRKTSQLNESQANGWRPYTIDGELPLRKNGGDDNRGQHHGNISKMYFIHWKPPGVSGRMWSVNLDASISGEHQTLGGYSCRPSE